MQKYYIRISEAEHQEIEKWLGSQEAGEQSEKRLKILLDLDESGGKRQYTTKKIVERRQTSEATISHVCRRYEEGGWKAVAKRKERETPARPAKVTGEVEAHIIATACSNPPAGKAVWSMQMIADKIVMDGVIESISDETVRKALKKRH